MDEQTSPATADGCRESSASEAARTAERLAALGQMARGMAHDFANLLMVIAGHAELSLEQLADDAPLRRPLEQIQHAAQQANDLCRELAAFAGRTPMALKQANLSDEIRRIVAALTPTFPAQARIELELAEALPPVEIDSARIELLLRQLVANAVDAIGQQSGTILVRTGTMTVDRPWLDQALLGETLQPAEFVLLEVADTGAGMDRATAQRMFDPFFTTRRNRRGLGLAAVLGVVRGHGGAIHVATQPGEGTTIRVLFPRGAVLSDAARDAMRKLLEG